MPLTPGQSDLVDALKRLTAEKGYAPTFRELAGAVKRSLATVRQRVASLERRGVLTHEEGAYRSLRTIERTRLDSK